MLGRRLLKQKMKNKKGLVTTPQCGLDNEVFIHLKLYNFTFT